MNDHVTTLRQISEMYRGTATSQTLREAADALATLEATILRLRQMEGDVQHLRHELLTARRPLEVEISRLKQQKDDAYARGKLEGWNAGRADGEAAEKVLAGELADAVNKEATGRLILEASTGMHGDVAKQLTDAWTAMASEAQAMREKLDEVHSWIVCSAIASADDMMQNADRIEEITRP